MANVSNIPLVSSEVAGIWSTYMSDSMAICVLRYFINRTDDSEVVPLLQYTLKISEQHIDFLTRMMNQEKIPIPVGFTEQDVDINAPRLFSDTFYLQYLTFLARAGLHNYTMVLINISRSDIRQFFSNCIQESTQVFNMLADIRLSKGVFIKAPIVAIPKNASYVQSSSFITDFFGEKRPLLNQEIAQLFSLILSNIVGRALVTGFGQVAKSKKVSNYFFQGEKLSSKQIEEITDLHIKEAIPIPSTSESFVTDSTVSTFSDKLMLFHIMAMNSMAIANIGNAVAQTLRADLQVMYGKLLTQIIGYIKDGTDIMIAENWMEQAPQAINHQNLGHA